MTPEEAARVAWVYHPPAGEPPDFEAGPDAYAHDAFERRLATVFAALAGLALGLGIGWGLPL